MSSEFIIAVHALVYLNHHQSTMSSEQIADNVCTNPARIRKILNKLKKANLIMTKEGNRGGYYFNLDACNVSLLDVYLAITDHIIKINWHSGNIDKECLIASNMAKVMDDVINDLDDVCMQKLKVTSIQDINDKIF